MRRLSMAATSMTGSRFRSRQVVCEGQSSLPPCHAPVFQSGTLVCFLGVHPERVFAGVTRRQHVQTLLFSSGPAARSASARLVPGRIVDGRFRRSASLLFQ